MTSTGGTGRRWALGVVCGVVIALLGRPASAAWQVDASGRCVSTWDADSLLRGPKAIANAPLLPFRQGAGAASHAGEFWKSAPVPMGVLFVPGLVLLSAGSGALESVVWIVGGVADLVTGGYFGIAPDQATDLSVEPLDPFFLSSTAKPPTHDRCGRPVGP